jgi:hypothetical protein
VLVVLLAYPHQLLHRLSDDALHLLALLGTGIEPAQEPVGSELRSRAGCLGIVETMTVPPFRSMSGPELPGSVTHVGIDADTTGQEAPHQPPQSTSQLRTADVIRSALCSAPGLF